MTQVNQIEIPLKYLKTPIGTPLDLRVSTYIYTLFHPFLLLKDKSLHTLVKRMPNYANGKIYKIVGEDGATYYGSTVQSLRERMYSHRADQKTSAYREIISQMNWEMIFIENYPCKSRKELEIREGWYIRENPCVNQRVAGRTDQEYHESNREKINTKAKAYERWRYSFGDPQYPNCLWHCDPSLFE